VSTQESTLLTLAKLLLARQRVQFDGIRMSTATTAINSISDALQDLMYACISAKCTYMAGCERAIVVLAAHILEGRWIADTTSSTVCITNTRCIIIIVIVFFAFTAVSTTIPVVNKSIPISVMHTHSMQDVQYAMPYILEGNIVRLPMHQCVQLDNL
jgi:hypothetical protein